MASDRKNSSSDIVMQYISRVHTSEQKEKQNKSVIVPC